MAKSNRNVVAAVTSEARASFSLERVSLDACRSHEVTVRMVAVGICHTDLVIRGGLSPIPALPAVLGHEGAGIVEEVGSAVSRVHPGDRVLLSFASCGHCRACMDNVRSRCANFVQANLSGCRSDGSHVFIRAGAPLSDNFFGQSSFASYTLVHETQVVRVADDLPLELLAPLGCGLQTGAGTVLNRLRPQPGSSMVVFGVGTVGLAAVMAAKVAGCATIIAIDRNAARLAVASDLGATHALRAGQDDVVEATLSITGGGADGVVEASGVASAVGDAIRSMRRGGSVCLLGFGAQTDIVSLPVSALMAGTIQTVIEGDSVPEVFIPQLIDLYRHGRFPFDRLIRYYDFADINTAVTDMEAGRVIKPVLRFQS